MQPWATIYAIRNTLEFTLSLSPRSAHLTRSRGMLAYLLLSLPSMLAHLPFCRGSGASRFTKIRYNLRKITYEIIRVLCKTNPILSAVGVLQMNANLYNTTDYENKWQRRVRKNKPNQSQFKRAKMNVNSYVIEDYRKKDDFTVRINKPNLVKGPK